MLIIIIIVIITFTNRYPIRKFQQLQDFHLSETEFDKTRISDVKQNTNKSDRQSWNDKPAMETHLMTEVLA